MNERDFNLELLRAFNYPSSYQMKILIHANDVSPLFTEAFYRLALRNHVTMIVRYVVNTTYVT